MAIDSEPVLLSLLLPPSLLPTRNGVKVVEMEDRGNLNKDLLPLLLLFKIFHLLLLI
jgi:hypothetical protein